jgi:hypothetical protein
MGGGRVLMGRFPVNIFFRVERRSVFINKPARFGATAIVHGLMETMGRKKTVDKFVHEGGQRSKLSSVSGTMIEVIVETG